MEGRFPGGIRTVLTNCLDVSQDAAFNQWYDSIHLPDIIASGLASHAIRYENADPQSEEATYLAVYEVHRNDLTQAGQEFHTLTGGLQQQGRMYRDVEIVRRIMWRRIGPAFATAKTGQGRVGGLFAVQSNCTDPQDEAAFNNWYDDMHIPDLLDTGLFCTAYRFVAVSPEPGRGRYLAIYETKGEPLAAVDEFARTHRPRLKATGRLSEIIAVTWHGIYRRLTSFPT